jgi:hypothetical protein
MFKTRRCKNYQFGPVGSGTIGSEAEVDLEAEMLVMLS